MNHSSPSCCAPFRIGFAVVATLIALTIAINRSPDSISANVENANADDQSDVPDQDGRLRPPTLEDPSVDSTSVVLSQSSETENAIPPEVPNVPQPDTASQSEQKDAPKSKPSKGTGSSITINSWNGNTITVESGKSKKSTKPSNKSVASSGSKAATAEVNDNSFFGGSMFSSDDLRDTKPVLNDDAPDWIAKGLTSSDVKIHPVSSSFFPTLEQCREDLNSRLQSEVHLILARNVLQHLNAMEVKQIDDAYIQSHLIAANLEYDNVQERPSGTYHQLWIGIEIDDIETKKIRNWERSTVALQRVAVTGTLSGLAIALLGTVSSVVGFLAKRANAKLKAS